MMNAYAYKSKEIEGTLTITLMSTAKDGEYSEYASAFAYNYAIAGTNAHALVLPDFVLSMSLELVSDKYRTF